MQGGKCYLSLILSNFECQRFCPTFGWFSVCFLCVVSYTSERMCCVCVFPCSLAHIWNTKLSWTLLLIHFHFFLRWLRPARPHHEYICFSPRDEGRGNEGKSGSDLKPFLSALTFRLYPHHSSAGICLMRGAYCGRVPSHPSPRMTAVP